ncbi:hypothetical protein [Ensifer canadensis]
MTVGPIAPGGAIGHRGEIAAGLRIGPNGKPVTINGKQRRKYNACATVDIGAKYALGEGLTLNTVVYNLLDKKVEQTDFNTVREGHRFWMSLTTTF